MKISNSNIQMASSRTYEQGGTKSAAKVTQEYKSTQNLRFNADTFSGILGQTKDEFLSAGYNKFGMSELDALKNVATTDDSRTKLRNDLLDQILKRFMAAGFSADPVSNGFGLSAMGNNGAMLTEVEYYEEEHTDFSTQGIARTEDGREIAFDVNISMSRSFMQYSQIKAGSFANALMDPLMVNVGNSVTQVSDKRFLFDLDADGEEEYVSMPTKGSGFLALDLNDDGVINDGSELFGAKSGDGFGDLRKYDSDGNGWIDENDEIFDKLKVWYKNDDGTDELVDLRTADIGAIFLGEQATDFSLTSGFNVNAMIRSTGIFLRESTGEVGTIQHVDLSTSKYEDEPDANAPIYAISDGEGAPFYSNTTTGVPTEVNAATISTEDKDEAETVSRKENKIDEARLRRERREQYKKDREAAIRRRAEQKKVAKEIYEKRMQKRAEEKERIEEAEEAHVEDIRRWRRANEKVANGEPYDYTLGHERKYI